MCAILVLFRFSFDYLIAISESKAENKTLFQRAKQYLIRTREFFSRLETGGREADSSSFGKTHVTGRVVCAKRRRPGEKADFPRQLEPD